MEKKIRSLFFLFIMISLLLTINFSCVKYNTTEDDQINFNPSIIYGRLTDQDGTTYKTLVIGTQTWMAENLKAAHYRNGDPIPNVTDSTEWINLTMGAYCDYENNSDKSKVYGKLYNWYAVMDKECIAPTGWHVPTLSEWQTLLDYLGGVNVSGGKLKETSTLHWNSPNTGATNESGFTALPGGIRFCYVPSNGIPPFCGIGYFGMLWSTHEYDEDKGSGINLDNNRIDASIFPQYKKDGLSIRCIKDK
jgi:uncharacterized protein (TIGR02145 family)